MDSEIRELLLGVQQGTVSVDQALLHLKQKPFEDLGYAKVDLHRKLRQGAGEVIYGAGKTAEQIAGILAGFRDNGQENVLITRMNEEKAAYGAAKGCPLPTMPTAAWAFWVRMQSPGAWGKSSSPPAAPATSM